MTSTATAFHSPTAPELGEGDVIAVLGSVYDCDRGVWLRADEVDSFPARVREVTANEGGGHTVHVNYLDVGYESYSFEVKAGVAVYRIHAAA